MKGRYGDFWESGIAGKTTDEMLKALSFSGFNGIYVDSYGYADNGKEIIASLSSILSVTPLKSDNGRLYFFDMTAYNAGLKPQYTAAEYAEQKTEALYPLYYEFRDGFSPLPSDASIQLCKAKGALVLTNFTAEPKKITLNATFETGFPEISDLKLVSSLFSDDLKINGDGYDYVKEIVVPPGKYVITLSCDAAPSYIPGKYMSTVFAVVNFKVVDHD